MTGHTDDESRFSPSRFFPMMAEKLDTDPLAAQSEPQGDHVLNPDLADVPFSYRDAAVLIPVIAREPDVTVLLTVRTAHLSAHAGQIAFPGGKIDPSDGSPTAAAVRETEEEVGLDRAAIHPIGGLVPYLSRTGYRIFPIVARVDPDFALTLNPNEVEEAFEVPLAFLMSPKNHRRGSRMFGGRSRAFYEIPFERHYIWGVTAGIIRGLYEQVCD
ncbi:CoA pyrophosphatase [Bauldia litoralis]|uniref:CoA pyrophosphatase n=1 Tax=Bauldia litoralis TaxID=665467 RepID=UPI00326533FF